MRKAILALLALALLVPTAEAAKKRAPHVVIQKQIVPSPTPVQPIAVPLIAVPPLLVFYDFHRRLHCLTPPDPAGLGGPGFDKPLDPAKGNVMIPCWQRRLMAGGTPTPTH